MANGTVFTLPVGAWVENRCEREVVVRPIVGRDEAWLCDAGASRLPAHCATHLLARCVSRVGDRSPVTPEDIRSLSIGDREAILLHLRRLTFGDLMQCATICPAEDCGEQLEWVLSIDSLLVRGPIASKPRYAMRVSEDDRQYSVEFRLPSVGDQEAAAVLAPRDPEAAGDAILCRCVERVSTEDGAALEPEAWPVAVHSQLPMRMTELDPQAEIELALVCPACGTEFTTFFDAFAYISQEISSHADSFYREIHLLAYHYHWSEAEILAMTPHKRRRYIDLLLSECGRGPEEP